MQYYNRVREKTLQKCEGKFGTIIFSILVQLMSDYIIVFLRSPFSSGKKKSRARKLCMALLQIDCTTW